MIAVLFRIKTDIFANTLNLHLGICLPLALGPDLTHLEKIVTALHHDC